MIVLSSPYSIPASAGRLFVAHRSIQAPQDVTLTADNLPKLAITPSELVAGLWIDSGIAGHQAVSLFGEENARFASYAFPSL